MKLESIKVRKFQKSIYTHLFSYMKSRVKIMYYMDV